MAAYCLFDVREIKDEEKIARYRRGVFATVEQYGGRYLVLGGPVEGIEGEWRPVIPVLIRFDDLESARRWYDSPEYAELKALRLSATRGDAVIMQGMPGEVSEG
jgi:uncharacterized protein (DUF1330 family)